MIELKEVRKVFTGGEVAVHDVSFRVAEGEICVLIGPSGCGKTTLLRLINKLLPLTSGEIWVGKRNISDEDPVRLRRKMGYAIQHVGLFPNMTVGENIAVVPKLENWKPQRISARVDELLDLVGLPPDRYRSRFTRELSGGEAQRVGVARALAADPPVLLMDEPFGALDPISRERLQTEFLEIQARVSKTVILVSHDMDEALRLGDRIVLMNKGRVEQEGKPEAFLTRPETPFVEEFLGAGRAFQYRAALSALDAKTENWSPEPGDPPLPGLRLPGGSTVQSALLALTRNSATAARIEEGAGSPPVVVTLNSLLRFLDSANPEGVIEPKPQSQKP